MSLGIDAAVVLRAFADHGAAFPALQTDIGDFARKSLVKQIKHKTFSLSIAAKARDCLGEKLLRTAIDGLSPGEATALLKKFDPNNPLVREGDQPSVRSTIDELIAGRAEPMAKPSKVPKATSRKASEPPPKPKIGTVLGSRVHAGDTASRSGRGKKGTKGASGGGPV